MPAAAGHAFAPGLACGVRVPLRPARGGLQADCSRTGDFARADGRLRHVPRGEAVGPLVSRWPAAARDPGMVAPSPRACPAPRALQRLPLPVSACVHWQGKSLFAAGSERVFPGDRLRRGGAGCSRCATREAAVWKRVSRGCWRLGVYASLLTPRLGGASSSVAPRAPALQLTAVEQLQISLFYLIYCCKITCFLFWLWCVSHLVSLASASVFSCYTGSLFYLFSGPVPFPLLCARSFSLSLSLPVSLLVICLHLLSVGDSLYQTPESSTEVRSFALPSMSSMDPLCFSFRLGVHLPTWV